MSRLPARLALVAAVVATLPLVVAAPARPDTAPIPPNAAAPGSDPNHGTPLELLLSQAASQLIGHSVSMLCLTTDEWNTLGLASRGWAATPFYAGTQTPAGFTLLTPYICTTLQAFGQANPKPALTCTTTTSDFVPYTVVIRQHVKRRVRIHGVWRIVRRVVVQSETEEQLVTHTVQAPCSMQQVDTLAASAVPAGYTDAANAVVAIAHEATHLTGISSESLAECDGMQRAAQVAEALGATASEAETMSRYYFDTTYARRVGTAYWNADCRENGPMDLTPGDGVWP